MAASRCGLSDSESSARSVSVPALVAAQGFFVPLDEEITSARANLAIAQNVRERLAFSVLIENLRQFQLSALEQLHENTPENAAGYDEYIDWAGDWVKEALADIRELNVVRDEAMRELSQEESNAVLDKAQGDFRRIQDRNRDVPEFVEIVERFEEHRRAANPEDE